MAYVITAPCSGVKDGACVLVCPPNAIRGRPDDPQLFIYPEVCLDCGACVEACPIGAVFADVDVPEEWHDFIALNDAKSRERRCPVAAEDVRAYSYIVPIFRCNNVLRYRVTATTDRKGSLVARLTGARDGARSS